MELQDFDIHIDAEGQWFHEGGPIKRIGLVQLFATILSCDEDGQHWLTTPVEKGKISVEDAPFIITELQLDTSSTTPEQAIIMRDNLGRDWPLGPDHRLIMQGSADQPVPYLSLEKGLRARLSRPVYYELAGLAEPAAEAPDRYGVTSQGVFFALDSLRPDDQLSDGQLPDDQLSDDQ